MRQQDMPIIEAYSQALLDAARNQNLVEQVYGEAADLRGILAGNPGVLRLMERPAIEKSEKKAFIRKVFQGRLSSLMLHLPLLLLDNYRGGQWDGILEYFISLVERQKGIVRAVVSTARSLSPEEADLLKRELDRFTGKSLRINYQVRPDLLGGVLFRYDDVLIDTTVRNGLREIQRRLESVKVA